MIQAKIIADSMNEFGNRITTMIVTMPRFILAEFNTHRMFSRNSASSRAIPFEKMVKSVQENPFIPIAWQKDHKGMQGTEYFDKETLPIQETNGSKCTTTWVEEFNAQWLNARDYAVLRASRMNQDEVTKQMCNRLLEPYMWHTVIVTATEWENFFALRCPRYEITTPVSKRTTIYRSRKAVMKAAHKFDNLDMQGYTEVDWLKLNKGQAEIHMMALAEAMWDAYQESEPKQLNEGQWHCPFLNDNEPIIWSYFKELEGISQPEWAQKYWEVAIKVATARCARVSYTVIGEAGRDKQVEEDIKLHDRLANSGHWSPMEHCARAMNTAEYNRHIQGKVEGSLNPSKVLIPINSVGWSGNFRGFIQYRKMFNNENHTL